MTGSAVFLDMIPINSLGKLDFKTFLSYTKGIRKVKNIKKM